MEIQANCKCGKQHIFTSEVIVKEGAILELPRLLKQYDAKKNIPCGRPKYIRCCR